jgi:hypothetical protein
VTIYMIRLTGIIAFCIFWTLTAKAQHPSKNTVKAASHRVSSIKNLKDGISVDQMVIVNNENLDSFIHDLQTSSAKLSYTLTDMPGFIKAFLESFSPDKFTIANPGKDWNCCCDQNESRPNRQLIGLGHGGHLFWMSYFTGGFAEIQHLVFISYNNEQVTDFWAGMVNGNLNDKAAIIQLLKEHKYQHWASTDKISI